MANDRIFLLLNNKQPHTTCDQQDPVQNFQKHNVKIKVRVIRNSFSSYLIRFFKKDRLQEKNLSFLTKQTAEIHKSKKVI